MGIRVSARNKGSLTLVYISRESYMKGLPKIEDNH